MGPDFIDPGVVPQPWHDPAETKLSGLRVAYHADNGIATPTQETIQTVEAVAKAGDDLDEAERIGVHLATELSARLLEAGAPGLHIYTLNRPWAAKQLFANLSPR